MPVFKIEQIALCPKDPKAAMKLLKEMGLEDWAHDHVSAVGHVFESTAQVLNEADLEFNYSGLTDSARELEILHYNYGTSWMDKYEPRASHIGMHITEEELVEWREFFRERGIRVAQEVRTRAHTNPVIAGKRLYHYVIFDTYAILGIDVKFIIRRDASNL